eukprot:TRINITY_DN3435_c0_g1_i1.p1 TRINITY_DN3435_c0_g1~~TRINITY_DN3435_c0_g1_i1.p1  ORF type:complete len:456 (+),score=212.58 TRINITY_DN3435_c0_g1_i1:112-1368(+)
MPHAGRAFSSSPLAIINPATEEDVTKTTLTHLGKRVASQDTQKTIEAKIAKAQHAQKIWSNVPLAQRIEIISRFAEALGHNADMLASVLSSETGKPIKQAKSEILATKGRVRFFMENVAEVTAEIPANSANGIQETIAWEPIGVVANVSAWNYPYFVSTNVIIPALLTGNSVLFKPSEHSALSGLLLVDLLQNAGVPLDAIIPIIGGGNIGSNLVSSSGINGVFFTGSYPTGVKIAQASAHNLVKLQEELGGKDGFYVREDVDIDSAVSSLADGAFYNTGQSCCSVERIYVHESIYEKFVKRFVEEVGTFKIGDPSSEETYIGPLTRKSQLDVLEDQVKDAVSKGAVLHLGGKRTTLNGKGYFFEPTVLSNVSHDMSVMKEESFGPIIGIQSVKDDDEGKATVFPPFSIRVNHTTITP